MATHSLPPSLLRPVPAGLALAPSQPCPCLPARPPRARAERRRECGAGLPAASAAGTRGRGCGQRAGGAYSPKGPRGLGAPAAGGRMGLSRARGLAGQRGETERRCPRRRRRHRAINTARPAAAAAYAGRLRTVRGPRPGSGSARAAAPGRGPGRLQLCGDLAAGGRASRPARPPPPLPSLLRRGPCAPRPTCPGPARPGPARFCRAGRCGPRGTTWDGRGRGQGGWPASALRVSSCPVFLGEWTDFLNPPSCREPRGFPDGKSSEGCKLCNAVSGGGGSQASFLL